MATAQDLYKQILEAKRIASDPSKEEDHPLAWKQSRQARKKLKDMGLDPDKGVWKKGTHVNTVEPVFNQTFKNKDTTYQQPNQTQQTNQTQKPNQTVVVVKDPTQEKEVPNEIGLSQNKMLLIGAGVLFLILK